MPDPTGRISHVPEMHRGVSWKQPVRVASTANATISTAFANGQTVDGITLATGDRILLKDQTSGSANGIYTVNASGAPTRAFDMDQDGTTSVPAEEVMGAFVYVIAGTTNGGTVWKNTNTSAPTLGSTSLTFAQFAGSGLSDPMTTRGDVIVRNSSNATARLATGSANQYLGSDGTDTTFSLVTDAKLSTSDITTNNVSTSKHGFAPKAPNDATKFLDGTGAYSVPAGSGSGTLSTVEEVDGTPTDSAVTKLVFPNGTLSITSHVATYTPAAGGSGALTLLSSTVLGSAAANITVTGISGSYKDLVVVARMRSTDSGVGLGLNLRVGSGSIDSGSNYAYFEAYEGWTSGNNNSTGDTLAKLAGCANSGATAGFFGYARLEILNYADSAKSKGMVAQGFTQDGSGILATRFTGSWKNVSAALDQIQILPSAGNLDTGSALYIYGRG